VLGIWGISVKGEGGEKGIVSARRGRRGGGEGSSLCLTLCRRKEGERGAPDLDRGMSEKVGCWGGGGSWGGGGGWVVGGVGGNFKAGGTRKEKGSSSDNPLLPAVQEERGGACHYAENSPSNGKVIPFSF